MKIKLTPTFFISSIFIVILLFTVLTPVFSQTHIKGKVLNIKDNKPVAFATVSLGKKKQNVLSDSYGNFQISIHELKNIDSLYITSVGFKSLKIAVSEAIKLNDFFLNEQAEDLQTIIIKSYLNEAVIGSNSEITGYFRSWNPSRTGGEIGKIFYLDHDDFKLERVRFKVNNQCDTCQIKLHIRSVVNNFPGEDLLTDSISTIVNKLTFDDRFSEFDLRNNQLFFKNKAIFVGLEVLNCTGNKGGPCTFSFIGTEQGNYIYKTLKYSDWNSFSDYSIYLKIFYNY